MRLRSVLVVLIAIVLLAPAASRADQLFWTDPNLSTIKRSVDGGSPQTIRSGADYSYVAADVVRQKLYYTIGSPTPMLLRSNYDGSGEQLLATFDIHNYPRGLAVDPAGGKIYWTSSDGYVAGNGTVRRANLDGSAIENVVSGMVYPYGTALDIASSQVYWIQQESNAIRRASFTGASNQSVYSLGGSSYAFSVAINPLAGKLYWTDPGNGQVMRSNLDGTGAVPVAALNQFSLDAGLAVNPYGGRLYWADTFNHAIYTSDLNGGGAQVLFGSGQVSYAESIAFVPEPALATGALFVLGTILSRGMIRRR